MAIGTDNFTGVVTEGSWGHDLAGSPLSNVPNYLKGKATKEMRDSSCAATMVQAKIHNSVLVYFLRQQIANFM